MFLQIVHTENRFIRKLYLLHEAKTKSGKGKHVVTRESSQKFLDNYKNIWKSQYFNIEYTFS